MLICLIINFFVLSLLPLVVIDTFFYSKAKEALIGRTFDQLNFVRAEKTTRINNFLQQRMNDASNMARNKESLAHLRLMAATKQLMLNRVTTGWPFGTALGPMTRTM